MHSVDFDINNLHTDLIIDNKKRINKKRIIKKKGSIITRFSDNNYYYSTISFNDITDYDSYLNIQNILVLELKRYLHINSNDIILVVGMGNPNSTPDSLGSKVLEHILVTRYFYLIGDVDLKYANVSVIEPNVLGNTGIESITIIKKVIEEINPTKVVIIDALKTNMIKRLVHTIQITNSGIHPGSGINNDQGEISYNTIGCDVIAIGVPTVIDINNKDKLMVTPTNIDFLIEQLANLIGKSLNIVFHKDYLRQI